MDRLKLYNTNKMLFECDHHEVYAEQFKRIQRVIGNFQNVVSYHVLANYQKLITLKVGDLLLGEAPKITAGEDGSSEQNTIKNIIEKSDLTNTCYMNVIDVSRYGDGLFYIYKDADLKSGKIDVTQPPIWFPVVSPDNIKKTLFHVLAWTYENTDEKNRNQKYLKVQIHSKGSYEERIYSLSDSYGTITGIVSPGTVIKTGLKDFAVVQVPNTITSDRVHGIDDYTDIDSLVSEIEVRISQIAKILDKHAEPSVSGPTTCLEKDPETGEYRLKMGNFFPRDSKDDAEVKYITWDAQLEANFKMIDKLVNILHTISEMGSAIFGDTSSGGKSAGGNAVSGSALKRLMVSPLAKVNRIRMRFDPALKKAIKLCSQLGGNGIVDLSDTEISIAWKDGLPEDPKEQADIMMTRTGNKATISQYRAIQSLDGLTDQDTQLELDRINEDDQRLNPINNNPPFGGDNGGGAGDGTS
jgi:SPP1 family phage portal protein